MYLPKKILNVINKGTKGCNCIYLSEIPNHDYDYIYSREYLEKNPKSKDVEIDEYLYLHEDIFIKMFIMKDTTLNEVNIDIANGCDEGEDFEEQLHLVYHRDAEL